MVKKIVFIIGCFQDLKSGKFTVYSQWLAMTAGILCFLGGLFSLLSNFIFSIIAIAIGPVILLLEISAFRKCCPTSPNCDKFINFFIAHKTRIALYFGLCILMFLSNTVSSVWIFNLSGLLLLFTAILYGIALSKGEEPKKHVSGQQI